MRVCVYGVGAVGGFVAARLAAAGVEVSAIARGATLAALRATGLTLEEAGSALTVPVHAAEDPVEIGVQDIVVLAVKTPALPAVAGRIAPLLGPGTTVVSAMNGIPWWFTAGLPGEHASLRLRTVDPDGTLAAAIPAHRVLGTVLHLSAASPAPGVVKLGAGERIMLGEARGGPSDRLQPVASLLAKGGFDVELTDRIQAEIWYKLWGNMTMNPLSALTGATLDRILDDPLVRGFATRCMVEAAVVGDRLGLPVSMTPDDRHEVTRQLGAVRTSMLQDVQSGRAVEIDALVAAVAELAGAVGVRCPDIDTLLGLSRLHARVLGLYPEPA